MKKINLVLISVLIMLLSACSGDDFKNTVTEWDCTVLCAEASTDNTYIITYSEQKISAKNGRVTIQNPNDFVVVVHLSGGEAAERTCKIAPGETALLSELENDVDYTVGVHAEVTSGTKIELMAYAGKR